MLHEQLNCCKFFYIVVERNLHHPLASLHSEHCHTWSENVWPTQCEYHLQASSASGVGREEGRGGYNFEKNIKSDLIKPLNTCPWSKPPILNHKCLLDLLGGRGTL